MTPPSFAAPLALLSGLMLLSGCAVPVFGGFGGRPAPAPAATPAPGQPASADSAREACITAGRDRGLEVLGVISVDEVTGPDGATARDVMLRVARDGDEIELRCSYDPEAGLARIMLI